ncbi:unnamed protein product [Mytilus coruscus]|uniref:Uncharacterized protein n=1 Tax=Mytilus coruscus TaxID=42192 RepID=A0A6J8F2R7_MYTCO|nr:unnamed protein product [Mytilus coruscus]
MIRGTIICLCLGSLITYTETVALQVASIALTAYEVISSGIDFIEKYVLGDPFGDSLQQLQRSIDLIHTKLDYLTDVVDRLLQLVKELPYTLRITEHVEKIKSCTKDLNNFFSRPTNAAALGNLKKCYDIMENVRSIGSYLSGGAIAGSPPLFDLYRQKEGTYHGETIKNMFTYLYTHFINGCAVVVTAEGSIYHGSSRFYQKECKATVGAIQNYMKNFFSKCIREMCPHFISTAKATLLKASDSTSAHIAMSGAFPWFQFLVLKTSTTNPNITDDGTFKMKSNNFAGTQTYRLFWTDSFVRFQRDGTGATLEITIDKNHLVNSYYGNLNITANQQVSKMQFKAYTTDTSIDHCDYSTGVNPAHRFKSDKSTCLLGILLTLCIISIPHIE